MITDKLQNYRTVANAIFLSLTKPCSRCVSFKLEPLSAVNFWSLPSIGIKSSIVILTPSLVPRPSTAKRLYISVTVKRQDLVTRLTDTSKGRLPLSFFSQASLTVHLHPFTLLGGQRHCDHSTMTQPDLDPRPLSILSGSMG